MHDFSMSVGRDTLARDLSGKVIVLVRLLIGVSGPSESGKSHATRFLERDCGTIRLKLVEVLRHIHAEESVADEFDGWPFRVEVERPDWLVERLTDWFGRHLDEDSVVTVESLYGPRMSDILAATGSPYALWYIDAPQEVRARRQQDTASLASLSEARAMLAKRDEMKRSAGLAALAAAATVSIFNNGNAGELHTQLEHQLAASLGCEEAARW